MEHFLIKLKKKILKYSLYPSQLFFSKEQHKSTNVLGWNMLNTSMSQQLGIPIIVALLFTPIVYKRIEKKNRCLYVFTFLVGFIFALMSTTFFPWKYMPFVPAVIQFPWRLLVITAFAFSIIAGINIYKSVDNLKIENMYIIVFIIMICSKMFILDVVIYDTQFDLKWIYCDSEVIKQQMGELYEYLPKKTLNNFNYLSERESGVLVLSGNAKITDEYKDDKIMKFTIEEATEETLLELPYIYYLGYNIETDENNCIEYEESDNGFIMIKVPKNYSGTIKIRYTGTKISKITFVISIMGCIGFIIYIVYIVRKNKCITNKN